MKSLQESVTEMSDLFVVYPSISESACKMITETLAEPHLLELAKQLHDTEKANNRKGNFADIFRPLGIRFDQVDSSNVKEYDEDSRDAGIKAARSVLNNCCGFVLTTDADGAYEYGFVSWGSTKEMVSFDRDFRGWRDVKPAQLYTYIEAASTIIVYTCNMKELGTVDIRGVRASAQRDMVPASSDREIVGWNNRTAWDEYCYKMAEANRKRYKEICAANKTKKNIDFKRIDDMVQNCLSRLMKATMNAKKNPERYADLSYDLTSMCSWVYDQRRPNPYRKNEMSGNDGVLYLYQVYNKLYMDLVNQKSYNADSARKSLDNVATKIEQAINHLNTYFLKFDA